MCFLFKCHYEIILILINCISSIKYCYSDRRKHLFLSCADIVKPSKWTPLLIEQFFNRQHLCVYLILELKSRNHRLADTLHGSKSTVQRFFWLQHIVIKLWRVKISMPVKIFFQLKLIPNSIYFYVFKIVFHFNIDAEIDIDAFTYSSYFLLFMNYIAINKRQSYLSTSTAEKKGIFSQLFSEKLIYYLRYCAILLFWVIRRSDVWTHE